MVSTVPADLLELKARFDDWRARRKYLREPIPDELRQAAAEMSRRYPASLVGRILKLDPSRLKRPLAKRSARTMARQKQQTTFIKLSAETALPEVRSQSPLQRTADCRLQLERPDGSRLTLMLPAFDLIFINRICAEFLLVPSS